jgi:hypothetical protein
MSSSVLTIVVMTRDRVELLKKALLSVFEHQLKVPPVIVSNNSTREYPEMEELQRQYGFSHIRQSGRLTATEHHNACLRLATTRWVWILHDDDELCPGAVEGVNACLKDCEDVGIVVGGVNDITHEGEVIRHWMPAANGVLRGDAALLELALNWGLRAPCQIFRTHESIGIGGFLDIAGYPSDLAFACTLAYAHGVRFHPEVIGRFRMGTHQTSHLKTDGQILRWICFHGMQAELLRSLGCDTQVANRIADSLMWRTFSYFLFASDGVESKPMLMYHLKNLCVKYSPQLGDWRQRVQDRFPFLFWGPGWIAWPLYRLLRKTRYLWSLSGSSKNG